VSRLPGHAKAKPIEIWFQAVCPGRAIGAGIVMPYANTEAMNEHLKEIGKRSALAPP
jgi:hypothetical protein